MNVSGSTIKTAECPGSDDVKLCVSGLPGINKIKNIIQNLKNPNLYIALVPFLIIIFFIIFLLM